MKANFKLFLLLLLFSCKEEMQKDPKIDIEGKWNLGSYESPDGDIKDQTYIIFKWYESGVEFVDKDTPVFVTDNLWKVKMVTVSKLVVKK